MERDEYEEFVDEAPASEIEERAPKCAGDCASCDSEDRLIDCNGTPEREPWPN